MPKRIDNRKRPGNRHTPESKARNRAKEAAKKAANKKPWAGRFVAFDGEGFDGKYTLLACSAIAEDIVDLEGLSTVSCLSYMTRPEITGNDAVVGYGLSYDFEMILKDLPEDDFFKLKAGEAVEIQAGESKYSTKYILLNYIPRKQLEIHRGYTVKAYARNDQGKILVDQQNKKIYARDENGKYIREERFKKVFLQDVLGFFQASFIKALEKWKIEVPPIIKEGKAMRGDFAKAPLPFIQAYNREELRLMVELMDKLRDADRQAFELLGLKPNHGPRQWYGPGSRASNFLNQTDWVKDHPAFTGDIADQLADAVCNYYPEEIRDDERVIKEMKDLKAHPFAAAYFGGRIEAGAIGTFNCKLWDYDVNSAYPYAISNLPHWQPEDLVYVDGHDKLDRMGMYHVQWNLPEGVNFYPFPFRRDVNVYFPREGEGWIMSPEVDAALEIYPTGINIICGYVLKDTEGAGNGCVKLPAAKLCTTAKKIWELAAERLKAKAAKESKENALKLVMNSSYGKTIQHVGSHKFLNGFAAAWITSTCRAIISRSIGKDTENNTVAIMTDGILTRKELPQLPLSKVLGEFDRSGFDFAIQLMPGIYLLEDQTKIKLEKMDDESAIKTGARVKRFRGMCSDFDARKAVKILHKKLINYKKTPHLPAKKSGYYEQELNVFVTRTLAVRQPDKYGEFMYQFKKVQREESFALGAKRGPGPNGYRLLKGEEHHFFPPKSHRGEEFLMKGEFLLSRPYFLSLQDETVEKDYDDLDEGEITDSAHIASIISEHENGINEHEY